MAFVRLRDRYGLLATLAAGYSLLAFLFTDTAGWLFDRLDEAVRGTLGYWFVSDVRERWLEVALRPATRSAP